MAVARKAYLLWSPGFGSSLLKSACVESILLVLCVRVPFVSEVADDLVAAAQTALLDGAHALKWWSAIATLASACCVIQLILTALSVGCSGINSLLGPLRPALLVATVLLQLSSWWVVWTRRPDQASAVAVGTGTALLLSFSPELLDVVQNGRRRAKDAETDGLRTATLKISKVSCAVCQAKVVKIAEGVAGIARCDVDIDTAVAKLSIARDADPVDVTARATEALTRGGYPPKSDAADADAEDEDEVAASCALTGKKAASSRVPSAASGDSGNAHDSHSNWLLGDARLGGVLGGLLGSSCCALQLLLNLVASLGLGLSGGCAGFNKLLGPLRPFTRAATATYLAIQWGRSTPGKRRPLLLSTILALTLTYMPEMLLLSGGTALAPPADGAVLVRVPISGMGCEACQHAVASVLATSSGVLDARVRGTDDEGIAEIHLNPKWGFNLSEVARKIVDAGFELDEGVAAAAIERAARAAEVAE